MIYSLTNDSARKRAIEAVKAAKPGWVVSIQPANRTTSQNSFYWATLHAISEQIQPSGKPHDPQVWHAYFKTLLLPSRMTELPNGQVIESEPTTTGLTKQEFSNYVDKVLAWGIEHGLQMTDDMSVLRVPTDTLTLNSSSSLMAP